MVHIEEVDTDEELEEQDSAEKVEKDVEKEQQNEGLEHPGTDEDSQVSEANEADDNEFDFSKPTPKDMLPGNIKGFKPPRVKVRKTVSFEECPSCDDSDYSIGDMDIANEDHNEKKKKRKKKDENITSKRAVALFMLFPMLATGAVMLYEMLGRFKFEKSAMQFAASIGGAIIALFFLSKVEALRSAVKFVLCFAWIIFLVPTYQVYSCSPIPLKNDMLGTWFSLKTEGGTFLESSYVTSECFRSLKFHSPYKLSMMSPKIQLTVDISSLINLNTETEAIDEDSPQSFSYFLLVSKRSVKKKFHKLYLLLETAPKMAEKLKKSLALSPTEKHNNLLLVTGSLSDIEEALIPMQKELQSMDYLIRPIKLKVHAVQYSDRYVKLKSTNNENLY